MLSCVISFTVICNCVSINEVEDSDCHSSDKMIEIENSCFETENWCFFKANEEIVTSDYILSQFWNEEELAEALFKKTTKISDDNDT